MLSDRETLHETRHRQVTEDTTIRTFARRTTKASSLIGTEAAVSHGIAASAEVPRAQLRRRCSEESAAECRPAAASCCHPHCAEATGGLCGCLPDR